MKIASDRRHIRDGVEAFRRELVRQCGASQVYRWSFPGRGGHDDLPTWQRQVVGRPLVVAIGRDGKWQLNLYDPNSTRVELMEPKPVRTPCCSPILELGGLDQPASPSALWAKPGAAYSMTLERIR